MPHKLPQKPQQWVSKKVLRKSNLTEEEYRQLGRDVQEAMEPVLEAMAELAKEVKPYNIDKIEVSPDQTMEVSVTVNLPAPLKEEKPKKKRGRPASTEPKKRGRPRKKKE